MLETDILQMDRQMDSQLDTKEELHQTIENTLNLYFNNLSNLEVEAKKIAIKSQEL